MTKSPVFLQKNIDMGVMHNVLAVFTAVVDVAAFGCRAGSQGTTLTASCPHWRRPPTRATARALWMCSTIWWTMPRLSWMKCATLNQVLPTTSLCFGSLSRSQTQESKALSKVKADNSEFAVSSQAEKADLAHEKRLAAVVASEFANKKTGCNTRSAKRFITACDDKDRISERIAKHIIDVFLLVVLEEIVDCIRSISLERILQRTIEKIMDAPVSHVQERKSRWPR